MGPQVVLEWLKIAEWFAIDDRLRRAIIARDARRRAGLSGHGTESGDPPPVNAENPDASPTPPPLTRVASRVHPSLFGVSAFSLPGRGVF
jgi:hypothetical protein